MKWISVEDRLPINNAEEMNGENYIVIPVIAVIDGRSVYSEFQCGHTITFWTDFDSDGEPTHWMPLPEPPNNTL